MATQNQQPIPFPLIQGKRTDHSSLDVRIDGTSGIGQGLWKYGLKSFSWSPSLEPGEARGASAQVAGLTRGILKINGNMEWYKAEADALELMLWNTRQPQGLLEWVFPVQITYVQEAEQIQPSSLMIWTRMTKFDESSSGSDPHVTKYDLYILAGVKNGIPLVTGMVMPGVQF